MPKGRCQGAMQKPGTILGTNPGNIPGIQADITFCWQGPFSCRRILSQRLQFQNAERHRPCLREAYLAHGPGAKGPASCSVWHKALQQVSPCPLCRPCQNMPGKPGSVRDTPGGCTSEGCTSEGCTSGLVSRLHPVRKAWRNACRNACRNCPFREFCTQACAWEAQGAG